MEQKSETMATEDTELDMSMDGAQSYRRQEVYCQYSYTRLLGAIGVGSRHPGEVVETACLSNVKCPQTKYQLRIGRLIKPNSISTAQIEAVLLACANHENVENGQRLGFLIGDGPGVGKGRMMAALIWENYLLGRKRSVWVSVSSELKSLVEHDLASIGADIPITLVKHSEEWEEKAKVVEDGVDREGILFITYSTLVKDPKRILKFLGKDFSGVIGFDECHRAKNLEAPSNRKSPSQFGLSVWRLQDELTMARVLYMSATGASEPRHLAYMSRLGLWGPGTAFPNFDSFQDEMSDRGVSAMEFLAMDMKRRGLYIARQLGFTGVSVRIHEAALTTELTRVYNDAVKVRDVILDIARAKCAEQPKGSKESMGEMNYFWGQHLSFFQQLCVAAKVSHAILFAKRAEAAGHCAIIGLQSTGDASVQRERKVEEYNTDNVSGFVSPSRSTLDGVLRRYWNFPPSNQARKFSHEELLSAVTNLRDKLPKNPLDELIEGLGGTECVTELTARRGRIIKTEEGYVYESRGQKSKTTEEETEAFMSGKKLFAIISDACSTGISLHSQRGARNTRKRVHITLELPWSADKAIQQFGRSHRSNEVHPPEYILLVSNLAGEKRFASTIARRMESMGAMTHGDRLATSTSSQFAELGLENEYGQMALTTLLMIVLNKEKPCEHIPVPRGYSNFFATACEALQHIGVLKADGQPNCVVSKFLNRILGIEVQLQNDIFTYFMCQYMSMLNVAKRLGKLDLGLLSLQGHIVEIKDKTTFPVCEDIVLNEITIDRGISWEDAVEVLNSAPGHNVDGFYKIRVGRMEKIYLAVSSSNQQFTTYGPATGESPNLVSTVTLSRYWKVSLSDAERIWKTVYNKTVNDCFHKLMYDRCNNELANIPCEYGRRHKMVYLLTGAVLPAWKILQQILPKMQLLRASAGKDKFVLGVMVEPEFVEQVSKNLQRFAADIRAPCSSGQAL